MKIAATNSIKYYNNQQCHIQNSAKERPQAIQSGVYNPIYYKDYNLRINFGKKSPEEFYAKEGNMEKMPDTMKKYLMENFAERSKVAPVQIMREAYDLLEAASTVEDIHEAYPYEPKFKKLRPANYETAHTGILKKIQDIRKMQDVPEPLFKDGCDDLTTYLVKKIYLEGKTVKEIDKDFAKDINSVYELAARVPKETLKTAGKDESIYFSHGTTYNLGIRFPEVAFWNSFISTRDDYDRVKRVRTADGRFVNADSPEGQAIIKKRQAAQQPQETITPKKPDRYKLKQKEVNRLGDAIINSDGNIEKALKRARRSGMNDDELSFMQKYFSQIMTFATEKIHLSEELIDFNETRKSTIFDETLVPKLITREILTKKEKTPLKQFWDARPDLKAQFSTAISDTTLMMSEAYGADGNNEEFQTLLKNAEQIKPEREARKLEHARIQAEYDEMGKQLLEAEKAKELETSTIKTVEATKVNDLLANNKKEPKLFTYDINGTTIATDINIKECTYQQYRDNMDLIPKKLVDTYLRELENVIKDEREAFYITCCYEPSEETPHINKFIMSDEKIRQINDTLIDIMETHHNPQLEATRFAFLEYANQKGLLEPDDIKKFSASDILRVRDEIKERLTAKGLGANASAEITSLFEKFSQPLTGKEKTKLKFDLFSFLKTYNLSNTAFPASWIPRMLQTISLNIAEEPAYEVVMKDLLGNDNVYKLEGPTLRYILDKKAHTGMANCLREQALKYLVFSSANDCAVVATSNMINFERIMAGFPNEKEAIYKHAQKILRNLKL